MRNTLLLLLVVLVALLVIPDESEGWGRRRRRWRIRIPVPSFRWVKKLVCNVACYKACSGGGVCHYVCRKYGCHFVWKKVFGRRRDSPDTSIEYDATENDLAMQSDSKSRRIYIPYKFSDYDTNKDSRISLEEFYSALKMGDKSTKPVFESMDRNGDKFLTCKEFRSSKDEPFKQKPIC